jgi:hypothetical protein
MRKAMLSCALLFVTGAVCAAGSQTCPATGPVAVMPEPGDRAVFGIGGEPVTLWYELEWR